MNIHESKATLIPWTGLPMQKKRQASRLWPSRLMPGGTGSQAVHGFLQFPAPNFCSGIASSRLQAASLKPRKQKTSKLLFCGVGTIRPLRYVSTLKSSYCDVASRASVELRDLHHSIFAFCRGGPLPHFCEWRDLREAGAICIQL